MIDEGRQFRELILKPSIVHRVRGARPVSGRISGTPLQFPECCKDRWMISVQRRVRASFVGMKVGSALTIVAIASRAISI
jgi:hypothetical protein